MATRARLAALSQGYRARRFRPLPLYGYGAYGISIPSSFSTNALSLADRGFVLCHRHIRGGKEKGYRWYEDGKLKARKTPLRTSSPPPTIW